MFYKKITINGVDFAIAVNITGEGAPTTSTEAAVGMLYMDETTGDMYKCTAVEDGVYTWETSDGKDGKDGKDGAAGASPHIGENGNWWIGEVDTGVKASVEISQTTGNSETAAMSQKAVTENLDAILTAFETKGGTNLLDPNNAEKGYFVNNGGVLGKVSNASCTSTVEPIAVTGGSTIYVTSDIADDPKDHMVAIWGLDDNGNYNGVSQALIKNIQENGYVTIPLLTNTTKIHIHVNGSRSFNNICISTTAEYEKYGMPNPPQSLKEDFLPDISETVKQIAIPYDSVEVKPYYDGSKPLEFPYQQKGLADNGALYDNANHDATDFISLAETSQIYATIPSGSKFSLLYITYYDENKNFIKGSCSYIGTNYEFTEIDGKPNSFAFPINAYPDASYVRISRASGNATSIEYTVVPYITEYTLYGKAINMPTLAPLQEMIRSGNVDKLLANNLNGKTIVVLGDSIFGNNQSSTGVVNQIAARVSGTVINGAFGGTRMSLRGSINTGYDKFDFPSIAQAIATGNFAEQDQAIIDYSMPTLYPVSLQALKNTDFNSVDIIIFNYGTNDWTSSTSKSTYQTAMENNVRTILQAYPHIQFYAVTPSWRCTIVDGAITQDSDSQTFEMGTLPEVIDAMKEVTETILHIPVIDCYNIGINKYNFANYFDGTDGAHQNANGRELLARHISNKLF